MTSGGKTIEAWAREIGHQIGEDCRPTTVYRWIDAGMISPVNIRGRLYVTASEDARFWTRASSGEFAVETKSVAAKVAEKKGAV